MARDPAKSELFTIRLKLPDGYMTLPHFHPQTEYSTVLSGTVLYGVGDKWDGAAMREISPGDFLVMKGGTHQYSKVLGETIIQVSGIGPAEQFAVK